ncbi:MAG: hypothetical protein QHH10_04550 [Peptococcaceae bacterium]|jgi:uncharacterized protein (DUF2164 family)|nr:hypothetical protein [Peptococcaceae bacterium]MDH7524567.1 hypothetical protein [Peptococcaceae bacterium]
MEPLLAKMKEYLQMDTEITFAEFKDYYHEVMDYLQKNYNVMGKEELFAAKFIVDIVSRNGKARAARKGPESKKYKKMAEKCSFWNDAINFRLQKEGLTQQEIDSGVAKVEEEAAGAGASDDSGGN